MTQKNDQLVRDNNIEMMHKQGHTKATAVTQCGFLNEFLFKSWWLTTTELFWKFAGFFSLHSDSSFSPRKNRWHSSQFEVSS